MVLDGNVFQLFWAKTLEVVLLSGSRQAGKSLLKNSKDIWFIITGMYQSLKIWGGRVVMRRAAAARRRLLICKNLGGPRPPWPPRLLHACNGLPSQKKGLEGQVGV